MLANIYVHLDARHAPVPKCKECGHIFSARPPVPHAHYYAKTGNFRYAQAKSKVVFDAEMIEYQANQKVWEQEVKDHLLTHPNGLCEFCGHVVKHAGLKAHQRSYDCQENQRKVALEKSGYLDVENDYVLFCSVFIELKNTFLHSIEWNDVQARRQIEHECTHAIESFEDLGNIQCCFTKYKPRTHGNGWQLRAFAPIDTAIALRQCLKPYRALPKTEQTTEKLLPCFYDMWAWLYMDDDQRGAAVGVWELATQSV